MANQRKGVPPGWTWRDGRPRWVPSPTLRAAGWRGMDLKTPTGQWLSRGASIDAAQALADAVAGWRAGRPVPADLAAAAPAGAQDQAAPPALADPRSIGALLDAYLQSREFEAYRAKIDRRSKLNRFVDVLAGYAVKPARDAPAAEAARYAAARARVRAVSIFALQPPAFNAAGPGDADDDLLYAAYWTLREKVGPHMAHGVLSDVSSWLDWCHRRRRAIPANWALNIDREQPPGRIRVVSWDELALLIEAAETLGLHSIADAIVLGVDLSWSQTDRLSLTWDRITAEARVKGVRRKTGRKGETPLLPTLGVPRLATIQARQAERFGSNVTPTHVIVCEATGKPWTPGHYRHRFADVRSHAAAIAASRSAEAAREGDNAGTMFWAALADSIVTARDQDLRDTAVTVAYDAGLDLIEIASRTLHSLKRIGDVLDKHYGEIRAEVADRGAAKLTAFLARKGVRL